MMLLTDDQRAALEKAVTPQHVYPRTSACIDAVRSVVGDDGAFALAVARHLLAADARLRAQADADAALARIGAALWNDGPSTACETMAEAARTLGGSTLNTRARELAQEATHGEG